MKSKSILLVIAILLIGLSLAGGTYAYLTMAANVTNGNYNTQSTCFNIDYNISNEGSGQDITGTLFPSSGPSGGLSGRVGIKVNAACSTRGLGTLKLHINSTTSSNLMTAASSYCQNRKTLEPISGITTEAACTTAGGRWRGYGDNFCENPATLGRMTDYTTENDCTTAGGTWKSGGSPLKYAVYDNSSATGASLSRGYITSTDIDTDKTIYDNFIIDSIQQYFYIFIWLDGYLVDNAVNDLPFSGYVKAEANQANIRYTYTTNIYDENVQGNNCVLIGQSIPNTITQYQTPAAAMAAFSNRPFYLKHLVSNGIVEESYVEFVITSEMASANPGMVAGTYYLKGGDNGVSFLDNAKTIYDAFGGVGCYLDGNSGGNPYTTTPSSYFYCIVSGLSAHARSNGSVSADDRAGSDCGVDHNGVSNCGVSVGGGGDVFS